MTTALKIQKIGTALGIAIPQSALDALALTEGDELYLTVDSGSLRITSHDPRFAEVLKDAREFMTTTRACLAGDGRQSHGRHLRSP